MLKMIVRWLENIDKTILISLNFLLLSKTSYGKSKNSYYMLETYFYQGTFKSLDFDLLWQELGCKLLGFVLLSYWFHLITFHEN